MTRASKPEADGGSKAMRTAERVLDLLELLGHAPDGMSLSDLTEQAGLPKPTVFRYLQTLEARGWVERDDELRAYLLGHAIPAPRQSFAQLARIAHPSLVRLAAEFGENIVIGGLHSSRVALLDVVESWQILRIAHRPQDRDYIHSTALGKAIGAQLEESMLRRLLEGAGMPALTDRTIVDADEFIAEVRRVRKRGYAIADRENDEDSRSVAVPMEVPRVHLALALTAPAVRFSMKDAEEAATRLAEEASNVLRAIVNEPGKKAPARS
jgi:IclR family transcriptional regulator, acetate operon repressor